jgi:hypothetical protein
MIVDPVKNGISNDNAWEYDTNEVKWQALFLG